MSKPSNQPAPAKTDLILEEEKEKHRYIIAFLFIASFMIIMVLALLATVFWSFTGIANLVGYFSGWVAAIIGFYFIQQTTAGAQTQARTATKTAAQATTRAQRAQDQKSELVSQSGQIINDLERIYSNITSGSGKLKEVHTRELKAAALTDAQKHQSDIDSSLMEMKEKLDFARDTIRRYSTS
jgi:flagellar basal body-associated protein FliL